MQQLMDKNKNWISVLSAVKSTAPVADFSKPVKQKSIKPEDGYDQTAGNLVLKMVALLERVEIAELKDTSRGKADVCLARQMAMYLMHTVFSCSYHSVASFFNRDRTTISHACKLVEDLRDNEPFDKSLETMENLLVSARALYELVERDAAPSQTQDNLASPCASAPKENRKFANRSNQIQGGIHAR